MTLTLELTDEQTRQLQQRARELGVDLRELAAAAVTDLLSRPPNDFERAAKYVLSKNRELYERLA
jgi:antitoxin FitA